MKKVSVIIPCYNVSLFIDRCMESLERQTIGIDNLEVILINDASKDATLGKLLLWEMNYPENILVIPLEENVKQGTARNIALDYCSGEYIAFLDADDWIVPSTLEMAYERAKETKAEIVQYLSVMVSAGPEEDHRSIETGYEDFFLELDSNETRIVFFQQNGLQRACWDKLYLREFIMSHSFRFAEGVLDEEYLFTTHACFFAKRYYAINKYLHRYFQNAISSVHNLALDPIHRDDHARVWYELYLALNEEGIVDTQRKLVEWLFVENYFIDSIKMSIHKGFEYDVDTVQEMQNTVLALFPNYWENDLLVRHDTEKYLKLINMPVNKDNIKQFLECWL